MIRLTHERMNKLESRRTTVLVARFAPDPPVIDGRLDEPAWARAEPYPLQLGGDQERADPLEGGEVKLLWDHDFLYVAARLEDSDIVQEARRDQGHFYRTGDLLEIFLRPEESSWYWEIYVTPNNLKSVFWFPGPGRRLPSSFEKFPIEDMKTAARVEGVLNDWRVRDEYWTVEAAIPARALTAHGNRFGPGSRWRVLLARYNYSVHLDNRELSMVPRLSWTNFHLLDEYGVLRFEE